jgi:tetratricopeptide (TPR) repeat protein
MLVSAPRPTLGQIRRALDEAPATALADARHLIRIEPTNAEAHRLAARALRKLGRNDEAEACELEAISASVHDPDLQQAAHALATGALPVAEKLLRERLKAIPHDVAAIRMFAELAGRINRLNDAENLLRRALELAPAFAAARANLATVLHRQNRTGEALAELDKVETADSGNPGYANLRAAALGRIGEFEEAIALYRNVLEKMPGQPKIWMSLGHALKTVGQQQESIAAYRAALDLQPTLGEVWWSLANLKTTRFADEDLSGMSEALTAPALSDDDRLHLHFALGKAHEQRKQWPESFDHYAQGNAIRHRQLGHEPALIARFVEKARETFSEDFFAERADWGCLAPDPIFIVGMPRAGSTLIEQILASHSAVEGTMELPDIPALVAEGCGKDGIYPAQIAALGKDEVRALGEAYLDRTRIQRKTDRPFFIDKLPNNWMHVGFIRLILPNARIIDARRHPLAGCFSNFKQHFARGQSFSYDLAGLGHYYAHYVALMAHWDAVQPGKVRRIIYEQVVEDSDSAIRTLLSALDLPFEESCLRFWETERPVRTASSEQVRRPINREGLASWAPYEPWLDPLKTALGEVLEYYPSLPPAFRPA